MLTLDFETHAIVGNPSYAPPIPVGLAYITASGEKGYMTDMAVVKNFLARNWQEEMCFHNSKFDVAVAMHHFGLPMPEPLKIHDTQFLLFLHDPHAANLQLKPSALRVLGIKPEEQDHLQDWILRNVPGATKKGWGAHISKAPREIVAPYAIGDVERTLALFNHLMPLIDKAGMTAAYQREQRLMPILLEAEKRGIRADIPGLELLMQEGPGTLIRADHAIFTMLQCQPFNLDSDTALIQALDAANAMSEWVLTPKGARSVAKDALRRGIRNPDLLALLRYRGGLATCLGTFGSSWLAQAQAEGGRLHPNWNQVRNSEGAGAFRGTRTGRLSCDHPNLTNPPNEFDAPPADLPPIPPMRKYLLPEEGHVWLKRDFSSQEIRILAHYEDDELMRQYQVNPDLDPHQMATELIKKIAGMDLPRKDVKITAFSTIYGAGVSGLAAQLNCDTGRAKAVREAYMAAIPGIRVLSAALRRRGGLGLPMRTWGGRNYLPEPPRMINGSMKSFEYKLLNYLIQGSAADQTKQSVIDWEAVRSKDEQFQLAMHDEIDISVPFEGWEGKMEMLKSVMNADRFDVPFKSEGFTGANFGSLSSYNVAGG